MEVWCVRKKDLNAKGYESLIDWLQDPNHVYIGRDMSDHVKGADGSKWANPFKAKKYPELQQRLALYKKHIENSPALLDQLPQLKGKKLGCWCHPKPCHGDILIQLLNQLEKQATVGNTSSTESENNESGISKVRTGIIHKKNQSETKPSPQKANRILFRTQAEETLRIVHEGSYRNIFGEIVVIHELVERAKLGSVCYGDNASCFQDISSQLRSFKTQLRSFKTHYSVTPETTIQAALRLGSSSNNTVILNFASAKNPGGGFLKGSNAQEESIARASALYACLSEPHVSGYYQENRSTHDGIYTDNIIYSPNVPIFRDDTGEVLQNPVAVSIITCPAVNRGALKRLIDDDEVANIMRRRIAKILQIAAIHGHKTLILGAWGCGVFKHTPSMVAAWFDQVFGEGYPGVFEEVTFAIQNDGGKSSLEKLNAFSELFDPKSCHFNVSTPKSASSLRTRRHNRLGNKYK